MCRETVELQVEGRFGAQVEETLSGGRNIYGSVAYIAGVIWQQMTLSSSRSSAC